MGKAAKTYLLIFCILFNLFTFTSYAAQSQVIDTVTVYYNKKGHTLTRSAGYKFSLYLTPKYLTVVNDITGISVDISVDQDGIADIDDLTSRYELSGLNFNADGTITVEDGYHIQATFQDTLDFYLVLNEFPSNDTFYYDKIFLPISIDASITPFVAGLDPIDLTYGSAYKLHNYQLVTPSVVIANDGYITNKRPATMSMEIDFTWSYTATTFDMDQFKCPIYIEFSKLGDDVCIISYSDVDGDYLQSIDNNTDQIADQQEQYRDEDRQDATTAGNDVAGAATELDDLKSKWEILWYPIEFTNDIMAAFSGSDNSRYRSRYAGVVGYSYDDSSGFLVPVYSTSTMAEGDIPESPGGTVITFPSYTLPVLNVKLWDSYSYDLSQITEQYPVLFNAIYVIITILEVYWFVGFLRDKYEEVFGK